MFRGKKKWAGLRGGGHARTLRILHSDSTSGCMINSLACRELGDKYAALRNTFCWLWHTQKIGWWIDGKTQGCRWHILLKKRGKCLSNQITPSAHSHTGLFRLVMDAITIPTCSSHLRPYVAGETPSFFLFLCRPQKGLSALFKLKQDVWLTKWFEDHWPKADVYDI